MKQHLMRMLGVAALVVPLGAWAQQTDLEVTIDVVPPGAVADPGISPVPLPPDAASEAHEASLFGRTTAANAQVGGEEFGQAVSEAARASAGGPPITVPKPPAP